MKTFFKNILLSSFVVLITVAACAKENVRYPINEKSLDAAFNQLEENTKLLQKNSKNPRLLSSTLKLMVEINKVDKTHYATEIIYPLYLKEKVTIDKSLKSYPKSDQEYFKKSIQLLEDEKSSGNG